MVGLLKQPVRKNTTRIFLALLDCVMILAAWVLAFENATVDAANSPLPAKYPGMLLDYSMLAPAVSYSRLLRTSNI